MPQDPWAAFVAIIGAIIVVLNIIDRVFSLKDRAKAPADAQNMKIIELSQEVDSIKRTLEKHQEFFANDNNRINNMSDEMAKVNQLVIKSLNALTEHALNGDNMEELKSCSKEMTNYLINK